MVRDAEQIATRRKDRVGTSHVGRGDGENAGQSDKRISSEEPAEGFHSTTRAEHIGFNIVEQGGVQVQTRALDTTRYGGDVGLQLARLLDCRQIPEDGEPPQRSGDDDHQEAAEEEPTAATRSASPTATVPVDHFAGYAITMKRGSVAVSDVEVCSVSCSLSVWSTYVIASHGAVGMILPTAYRCDEPSAILSTTRS